ncbi:MAG TPA: hypothetical protein VI483_03905 [Candidatus Paceibacterota bacterium]
MKEEMGGMNRRRFLTLAGGAAAGAALPREVAAQEKGLDPTLEKQQDEIPSAEKIEAITREATASSKLDNDVLMQKYFGDQDWRVGKKVYQEDIHPFLEDVMFQNYTITN